MVHLFAQPAWMAGLLGAVGAVLAAAALLRARTERVRAARLRSILFACWESYLESLDHSLERMRSLRALLAAVRSPSPESELARCRDLLYQRVRDEIQSMEGQLDTLLGATDAQWFEMAIAWRPVLDMQETMAALLRMAEAGVSPAELARLREEWRQRIEPPLRGRIAELEAENAELRRQAGDAAALEKEVRRLRAAPPPENEEAVAARLMGALADDLSLEQIDIEFARVDGELHYCATQMREADADLPALEARIAWMRQVRRWWQQLRNVRKYTLLLDEATAEASEGEAGADPEEVAEFQRMESQNARMRGQIQELLASNRQFSKQMELLDVEKADIASLRQAFAQVDAARKTAQRELDALEKMVARMETDLFSLQGQAKKAARLERQLLALALSYKKQGEALAQARAEQQQVEETLTAENALLQRELREAAEKTASSEGMVPEEEVLKLQGAYDQLNAQMMQMRGARMQSERTEKQAVDELEKLRHSHQDLQHKHRELREQFAVLMRDLEQPRPPGTDAH